MPRRKLPDWLAARAERTPKRQKFSDEEVPRVAYIKEQDAARYLGVSIAYLRKTRLSGSLPGRPCPPFTRLGRMVRYGIAELDAFMAAHKVNR